jgi:hypothetical protein
MAGRSWKSRQDFLNFLTAQRRSVGAHAENGEAGDAIGHDFGLMMTSRSGSQYDAPGFDVDLKRITCLYP